MKLGPYSFDAPVFLAPMAGVTDTAYRIIAHDMGCPLCYAEMVSSQGIHFRNERTLEMLQSEPEERPLAMQLFAATPEMAAEAPAVSANPSTWHTPRTRSMTAVSGTQRL